MIVQNSMRGALLAAMLFGVGCSKGPKAPTTIPVSGVIKYNGQPVAQATVTFLQKETSTESAPHPAHGTTDDQGRYTLLTFVNPKEFQGAVPGDYAVTVTKTETGGEFDMQAFYKQQEANIPKEGSVTSEQGMQQIAKPPLKSAIPAKYNDLKTTDLTASVKPSGAQTFDFDLKD
jgi:hypothetical protein